MRRCQFSALVEAGKQQEALAFARTQLTPLAGGDDGLMREVGASKGYSCQHISIPWCQHHFLPTAPCLQAPSALRWRALPPSTCQSACSTWRDTQKYSLCAAPAPAHTPGDDAVQCCVNAERAGASSLHRVILQPLGFCWQVKAVMGAILIGGAPAVTREAAAAGLQKSVCEALGLQVTSCCTV